MLFEFSKADVERVYDEVERRWDMLHYEYDEKTDSCVFTPDELIEIRYDMMQGVYSALMVLAKNWPDVRSMTDHIEEERWGKANV